MLQYRLAEVIGTRMRNTRHTVVPPVAGIIFRWLVLLLLPGAWWVLIHRAGLICRRLEVDIWYSNWGTRDDSANAFWIRNSRSQGDFELIQ